jgi:uncharacterized membrane protein
MPQHIESTQQVQAIERRITAYSGPLPPGEQIEVYERLYPGAVKIVMDMAVEEQHHRHAVDLENVEAIKRQQENDLEATKRYFRGYSQGQVLGFLVCLAAIAGSIFLGATGHDAAAIAIAAVSLAGIVRAFTGKK